MKIIITGATGMVGKGVLLECLDHSNVEKVLTIGRSEVDMKHPKLEQIIHTNFNDFSSLQPQLKGYDAVYQCMGVSAVGLSEEKYHEMTFDYTLALAKELMALNPEMTCTYVSGVGTDSTEKGNKMWARVKGKTENALLQLGFKQAFMFRPGIIIPLRGIKSKTKLYQFFYDYFLWLFKLMKWMSPKSIVDTTQIGFAMINVTKDGYERDILEPEDILEASK